MGPPEFYTELCQKVNRYLQLPYRNVQFRKREAVEDTKKELIRYISLFLFGC